MPGTGGEAGDEKLQGMIKKYPVLHEVWGNLPVMGDGKYELDLKKNASETWKDYKLLLKQSILHNIAWLETKQASIQVSSITSGAIQIGNELQGYDFLMDKPSHPPCMTQSAAFPIRYAHVLPAMMLSNFLKRSQSDSIDMTVLCQGYAYTAEENWWTTSPNMAKAEDAARFLVESEDFQAYVTKVSSKRIKRICIWVLCAGHTFSVVWEQGEYHDAIYFIDNAAGCGAVETDEFRDAFLNCFKIAIAKYRSVPTDGKKLKVAQLFKHSRFTAWQVAVQDDLTCVSFMARCTAYLNTMDAFVDDDAIAFVTDVTNVRYQALCYAEFEEKLHEFLRYSLIVCENACVWLPKAMHCKFLNIDKICLLVFDLQSGSPSDAMKFEYFLGPKTSSFQTVDREYGSTNIELYNRSGKQCGIMSQFHSDGVAGLKRCVDIVDLITARL
jgi:hypothetical protein